MRKKNNNLIRVSHPEKGTRYFTNQYRAAIWAEVHSATIASVLGGVNNRDGIKVDLVDGSDVKWKDVN